LQQRKQFDFFNLNIERSVLSSLLNNSLLLKQIALSREDFYLPFHKNLFDTLSGMLQKNIPFDDSFIQKIMVTNNQFDEEAMLEVLMTNPLPSLKGYVDVLYEYSQKRELYKKLNNLLDELPNTQASEVIGNIAKLSQGAISTLQKSQFNIQNINDIDEEGVKFICKDWIPFPIGSVSIIAAPGGSGKSFLALQIALRFLQEFPNEKACLWLSEDPLGESKKRAKQISLEFLGKDLLNFDSLFITNEPPFFIINKKNNSTPMTNPLFFVLKETLKPYKLIIWDPLIAFYGGDESNNSDARFFMQQHFTQWALEEDKVIIFLHHSTKDGKTVRGASALPDAARLVYDLGYIQDKGKDYPSRTLSIYKENYGIVKILGSDCVTRQVLPKMKIYKPEPDANF